MADITFNGFDAFRRDLERLQFSKRRPVLVKAAIKSMEPARVDAGRLAPRDTGQLSRDFVVQEAKGSDLNEITVELGALKRSFYILFQEFGTKFHPPQKSIGPAIESNMETIQESLGDNIQAEINAALPTA